MKLWSDGFINEAMVLSAMKTELDLYLSLTVLISSYYEGKEFQ